MGYGVFFAMITVSIIILLLFIRLSLNGKNTAF